MGTLRSPAWPRLLGLLREVQAGSVPSFLAASAEPQPAPGCLCCNAEGWVGRPECGTRHALTATLGMLPAWAALAPARVPVLGL